MAIDPQNASDPKTANHHWYPFLRYQEECKTSGKEATVDGWLRSQGKLKHQIAYEEAKVKAASKAESDSTKESTEAK